jgi:histidinol-phosphate aminotransferase
MSIDFKNMPHEGIRSLIPYKPGKSIEELAREKGLSNSNIIKLASNENPLGCSPSALNAIKNMSPQTIATYPSPINHPIMPKLAQKLGINCNQLFLSNGSDYLYNHLLNCFSLHNGKHILTHDYAFSTYAIQAKSLNIPVHQVPIGEDWQVSIDNLINACNEHTSLVFIANPNNPTGILIPLSEIKRLLTRIPPSTILVLDEAYFEYASHLIDDNSLDWLEDYPNLIITRTFSKIYGLAGIRLGYAIAHPSLIELLYRVQLPFAVNQVALLAANAALDDNEFIKQSLTVNNQGMQQMMEGLDALGLYQLPSACNFITFDCQEECSMLYEYLLNKGIIVRPLTPYKMDHFIRVTIGTEEQNTRFLNALIGYYS